MPTHSQHPRRDRPRRHKGVDVSHPRCIMVSSRKHHRSVLRYRPDRGRDHVVGADPSQGMAGRVREPRRWWLGVGPSEWSGPEFFAFSAPQGLPGGMGGTSRVSLTNRGIGTLGECWKTGEWLARRPLTWHFVIDRRANGGFLGTLPGGWSKTVGSNGPSSSEQALCHRSPGREGVLHHPPRPPTSTGESCRRSVFPLPGPCSRQRDASAGRPSAGLVARRVPQLPPLPFLRRWTPRWLVPRGGVGCQVPGVRCQVSASSG